MIEFSKYTHRLLPESIILQIVFESLKLDSPGLSTDQSHEHWH